MPGDDVDIAGYALHLDGVDQRSRSELSPPTRGDRRHARRRADRRACIPSAVLPAAAADHERDRDPHQPSSPISMSRWAIRTTAAAAGPSAPIGSRWCRGSGSARVIMAFGGIVSLSDRRWRVGVARGHAAAARAQPRRRATDDACAVPCISCRWCCSSVLAGYFALALRPGYDPQTLPSAMIDKPAPAFDLAGAARRRRRRPLTRRSRARSVLVNFFASWCVPCRVEHPVLMRLAERRARRAVSASPTRTSRRTRDAFLAQLGDPYRAIGLDPDRRAPASISASTACRRPM